MKLSLFFGECNDIRNKKNTQASNHWGSQEGGLRGTPTPPTMDGGQVCCVLMHH